MLTVHYFIIELMRDMKYIGTWERLMINMFIYNVGNVSKYELSHVTNRQE